MNKQWTDENVEFLRANWLKISNREISRTVQFDPATIRRKAQAIGLEKKVGFWTEEKIQGLRDNWLLMTARKVGDLIGAQITAVKGKAKQLGLASKKNDWWTEERDNVLREMWPTAARSADIAAKLGRSKNSVIGRAHRLGLVSKRDPKYGSGKEERERRKAERLVNKPEHNKGERLAAEIADRAAARTLAAMKQTIAVLPLDVDLAPLRISLFDLKRSHCRWPCDEVAGPISYCGHQTLDGQSYCPTHYRMSYQPTNTRTRSAIAAELAQRSKKLEAV